ncbi:MAG: SMC-Scp complex subunit ScpB [Desulfobacterales bacterium]|nr:SMC-Scp complex subunit ScpB [Desulfobacterales bacterium]
MNENIDDIEAALPDLIMDFASRESAFEIDDEDGYIIQVRQEYMDIVEKLVPVELKSSTLRTLSVIAQKNLLGNQKN